jgi:hypothetical protein
MSSLRSPKAKYRVEMTYGKSLPEIGQLSSFTCDEIDINHNQLQHHINQAKSNKTSLLVVWKENKSTYPSFNWVEVKRETYD